MLIVIVVGLCAGVITSLSPCVLPVLPVVLAASTNRAEPTVDDTDADEHVSGSITRSAAETRRRRRRPFGVVLGLVLSFSASTLFGSLLLSALHLPQDLLRDLGIAVLAAIGVSLIFPRLADLLERPFARITPRRQVGPDGNGLVTGLGLGLLFVPCAGPVLATIAVIGATHRIGLGAVVLTVAFGIGVGVPLLALALAGDALARRTRILRTRARTVRIASGLVMIVVAGAIAFNLTDGLQRHVPGYTTALQKSVEQNKAAAGQLSHLTGGGQGGVTSTCAEGSATLVNCGAAPDFHDINQWLNTTADAPLTLAGLRGKVVLIDFWTYSCINCQRTLPHVEAWNHNYADDGLVVVGVHTPEFAFEHVTDNVRDQAAALGVTYPIAIDNGYGTWRAYSNQYWPAEYLIDATGVIRHITYGEGGYADTETLIRQLLIQARPGVRLGPSTDVPTASVAAEQTQETYLGYKYQPKVSGETPNPGKAQTYRFPPEVKPDTFAISGEWTSTADSLQAGEGAQLRLNYRASKVFLVLGGTGTVTIDNGVQPPSVIHVGGAPALYTVIDRGDSSTHSVLTLSASAGITAYDFTFG